MWPPVGGAAGPAGPRGVGRRRFLLGRELARGQHAGELEVLPQDRGRDVLHGVAALELAQLADQLGQRLPLDVLHRVIVDAARNRWHRPARCGCDANCAAACASTWNRRKLPGSIAEASGSTFKATRCLERLLLGLVDDPHAASADLADDPVVAESRAQPRALLRESAGSEPRRPPARPGASPPGRPATGRRSPGVRPAAARGRRAGRPPGRRGTRSRTRPPRHPRDIDASTPSLIESSSRLMMGLSTTGSADPSRASRARGPRRAIAPSARPPRRKGCAPGYAG